MRWKEITFCSFSYSTILSLLCIFWCRQYLTVIQIIFTMIIYRAAPHKRLLFAAWYQCVAKRHKEDCLVIELAHNDWNPCPVKRNNLFAIADRRMEVRYLIISPFKRLLVRASPCGRLCGICIQPAASAFINELQKIPRLEGP